MLDALSRALLDREGEGEALREDGGEELAAGVAEEIRLERALLLTVRDGAVEGDARVLLLGVVELEGQGVPVEERSPEALSRALALADALLHADAVAEAEAPRDLLPPRPVGVPPCMESEAVPDVVEEGAPAFETALVGERVVEGASVADAGDAEGELESAALPEGGALPRALSVASQLGLADPDPADEPLPHPVPLRVPDMEAVLLGSAEAAADGESLELGVLGPVGLGHEEAEGGRAEGVPLAQGPVLPEAV